MENGLNNCFDVKLVFNKIIHAVFAQLLNDIDPNPLWFDNNFALAKNFLNE